MLPIVFNGMIKGRRSEFVEKGDKLKLSGWQQEFLQSETNSPKLPAQK
jgi:hypothetical protein